MATNKTQAPFREPQGIFINKEETGGNGLDKGVLLTYSHDQIIREYDPSPSGEKISAQELYKVHLPSGLETETPRTIRLIEMIQNSLSYLSQALDAEDIQDSVLYWRQLFGNKFPSPPSSDKKSDDSGYSEREEKTKIGGGRFA